MERCQAQAEANFIYRLQTVGGFGGKVRSVERVQRLRRRSRFLRRRISRGTGKVTPEAMQRASRAMAAARGACQPQRRPERPGRAGARRIRSRCRCRDGGRSLAASVARPRAARSVPRDSPAARWPTACGCGPSSTTRCRSSVSSRCCPSARAAIRTTGPASRRSRATCSTKARGDLDAHRAARQRSAASAAISIRRSDRTRPS